MGKKVSRENRNLRFETLQLHVGQEHADPVTDEEQFQSIRHPPMFFITASMQQPDLD